MTKNIKIITDKETQFEVQMIVSKYAKEIIRIYSDENGNVHIGFKCSSMKLNKLRMDITKLRKNDFKERKGA